MIQTYRHMIRWLPLYLSLFFISNFRNYRNLQVYAFTAVRPIITTHTKAARTELFGIKGFRAWFESQFPEAIFAMPRDDAQHEFDHVLIDVNQLLHIALRRSRSEGHALTLLMKELDSCCAMATPKRSVVLAMDGPPSAAKLATQRRRRYATVVRNEFKQHQLTKMMERGAISLTQAQEAKKRRRYLAEIKTLRITPGTEFMDKAHQAILYWAWQRISNPKSGLSNVRVYLSPSSVPGEGEVKLLDWILRQNVKPGSSVAILGGDSDLVLEGLVIPPSITHNVHILLPDGNKKYLAVSLWETTRALAKFLPKLDPQDMMRVRTDLVLLLIMNGNDYLPKLRGSSGFNKLFHNYLRLLHQWLDDPSHGKPFLVDPDSVTFNLPFALAYFRHLSHLEPTSMWNMTDFETAGTAALEMNSRTTPLSQLNNFMDSGFLPEPIKWRVFLESDMDHPADRKVVRKKLAENRSGGEDNDDDDDDDNDRCGEQVLLRLTLGKKGTEQYFSYEVWHDSLVPLRKSKQHLASLALEELLGVEVFDNGDATEEEMDETDDDFVGGITSSGYSWEVHQSIPGKVDTYLGGLLWNLQTYQDGICSDYAYNYGKRMSPTASEIVDFLKDAAKEKRTIGREELLGSKFHEPVSAGLSCLAALPSQVCDLVPEPYQWLAADNTVEELYAMCMDPNDNVFDIDRFQQLVEDNIEERMSDKMTGTNDLKSRDDEELGERGRRIITGDHYWTVLSRLPKSVPALEHPFEPPPPFSDRLSYLKQNRRLKVSRAIATAEPLNRGPIDPRRKRRIHHRKGVFTKEDAAEIRHSDMGGLLTTNNGKKRSIESVEYNKAYKKFQDKSKQKRKKKKKFDLTMPKLKIKTKEGTEEKKKQRVDFDVADRKKNFNLVDPPKKVATNVDGFHALQLLQQLSDSHFIGALEFDYKLPSDSNYAAFYPDGHELVRLVVHKGENPKKIILDEVIIYEQDRDINAVSRKAVKQHLACFALCDLIDLRGPPRRWSEMRYKDIKSYLLESGSATK